MKKEYVHPELDVLSLVVEDNTNDISLDDNRMSMGGTLGDLFN